MDKQQVISFIEGQIKIGAITKADLLAMAGGDVGVTQAVPVATAVENPVATEDNAPRNLIHTFYGIGAIIALIGVVILVGQNWTEIGFVGRVLVTLGISFVTYAAGLILAGPEQKAISQVMFTISAALAPLGSYVLLSEANVDFTWVVQIVTAGLLTILFGTALFISKRNILVLITIGYATWAYYAMIFKFFDGLYSADLFKFASMLLGASYILIAYGYGSSSSADQSDEKERKTIQDAVYGFGTLFVLGAGILVGNIFDMVYIAFIFAAFYGSVYLKSRSMLVIGAFYLMAHIIKLTSKYFIDSIGWPIALILVGFLVIGIGYLTFYLNKKFISYK
jgi:hypothetical protein